jgi:hypothetical protein
VDYILALGGSRGQWDRGVERRGEGRGGGGYIYIYIFIYTYIYIYVWVSWGAGVRWEGR